MAYKTLTLPDFLTENQIAEAGHLFKAHGPVKSVDRIRAAVIEPNLATINAKLGQENDARYLAYAVLYVLMQASKGPLS